MLYWKVPKSTTILRENEHRATVFLKWMDFMTDIVPKNFRGIFMSQKLSTSPQICPQNHGSKSQYCPRNCQQNCHKSRQHFCQWKYECSKYLQLTTRQQKLQAFANSCKQTKNLPNFNCSIWQPYDHVNSNKFKLPSTQRAIKRHCKWQPWAAS